MLRSIIEFSLKQRIVILLMAFAILIAGFYSFLKIPIDAFPDISSTQVKIILKAPGMTPEEVKSYGTDSKSSFSTIVCVKTVLTVKNRAKSDKMKYFIAEN